MNKVLIVSVLFLIGFISDLFLQFTVDSIPKVDLFKPFWKEHGVLRSAIIAGMITLIFGGLFLVISLYIYSKLGLKIKSWSFVLFSTAVAFVLGVFVDIITNRTNFLGDSFRGWYSTMGATDAALWSGGLAFAFTVFIASTFLKYN